MHTYSQGQNDRVFQLSGKLTSIINNLESDKGYYAEQIEKRVNTLETILYESIEQDGKKFKILAEKVGNLQEKVEDLKNLR